MALLKAILGSKANFVPNVRGMIGGLRKSHSKKLLLRSSRALNFTISNKYGCEIISSTPLYSYQHIPIRLILYVNDCREYEM